MFLGLNTFIYETGEVPVLNALKSAQNFGFKYIDLAAYKHGDPTQLPLGTKKEIISAFSDYGFVSSQLLLANTQLIASPNTEERKRTLDYMKACGDFQLELGGKQVLVCWGCGVLDASIPHERSWINLIESLSTYSQWCSSRGIIIDLELDPHVYFVVNNLEKMVKIIEDVGMPNIYPNVDIGHLVITREGPERLNKIRDKVIHAHLSETDTFEHTNSILGTGKADFKAYIDKLLDLGIEKNCDDLGEASVASIEMGEPGHYVEDPDRWVEESLRYIQKIIPNLKLR